MATQTIPNMWEISAEHYRAESDYWFREALANLRELGALRIELLTSLFFNFLLASGIVATVFIGLHVGILTKIVLGLCYSAIAVAALWRLSRLFGK